LGCACRAAPQGLAFLAKELFRQRFSAAAMSLAAEGLARGMAPDAALAVYIIEQLCKKKKQSIVCVSLGEGQEPVAIRAMNAAALNVYQSIRKDGTQQNVLNTMQSRNDLYDYLGYHAYEQKLDGLFAKGKQK
jgi:hypothetical protein